MATKQENEKDWEKTYRAACERYFIDIEWKVRGDEEISFLGVTAKLYTDQYTEFLSEFLSLENAYNNFIPENWPCKPDISSIQSDDIGKDDVLEAVLTFMLSGGSGWGEDTDDTIAEWLDTQEGKLFQKFMYTYLIAARRSMVAQHKKALEEELLTKKQQKKGAFTMKAIATKNLEAARQAAYLEAAEIASTKLLALTRAKAPAMLRGYLDGKVAGAIFRIALANFLSLAQDRGMLPESEHAEALASAMMVSAQQQAIKTLDIPGMIDTVFNDSEVLKALGGGKKKVK